MPLLDIASPVLADFLRGLVARREYILFVPTVNTISHAREPAYGRGGFHQPCVRSIHADR